MRALPPRVPITQLLPGLILVGVAALLVLGLQAVAWSERDGGLPLHATAEARAADAPAGAWVAALVPLPPPPALDRRKVRLGERLFHDPGFSADGSTSCASCHDLDRGGVDGLPVSRGVGGALGAMNAPTVFNVGLNSVHTWNGRARTLEQQLDGPVQDPREFGSSWPAVVAHVGADAGYVAAFQAAYGERPSEANIKDALVTFERSLVTAGGPYDRWLRGAPDALDAEALRGVELFVEIGCTSCHQGANLGGNLIQRLGVVHEYYDGTEHGEELDRFQVTGRARDRHCFRVPSLRHVAETAPYLHDGSVASLDEVIEVMAWHQLGLQLEPDEVAALAAFLRALGGTAPVEGPR